jgi:hypothetical protein
MVNKVELRSQISADTLKVIEEKEKRAPCVISSLMIPLILTNHDQFLGGQTKKLKFAEPCQLCDEEIRDLQKKALFFAKLIIQDGQQVIKIDNKFKDFDYEEIAYEYLQNGKLISKTHKKGEESITEMEESENDEIQDIVKRSLFATTSANENKNTDDYTESRQYQYYSSQEYLRLKLTGLILAPAINAVVSAERRAREERDMERRLDEQAVIERDIRKRSEKKREERWKQTQKHFEIKDQKRDARLSEARKSEDVTFDSKKRKRVFSETL